MFYTYVLYSEKFDKIYVGSTSGIEKRIASHNEGRSGYTKKFITWKLIYYEEFTIRSSAMKREKELKTHQEREIIRKTISVG
jgi:putative endonuclease